MERKSVEQKTEVSSSVVVPFRWKWMWSSHIQTPLSFLQAHAVDASSTSFKHFLISFSILFVFIFGIRIQGSLLIPTWQINISHCFRESNKKFKSAWNNQFKYMVIDNYVWMCIQVMFPSDVQQQHAKRHGRELLVRVGKVQRLIPGSFIILHTHTQACECTGDGHKYWNIWWDELM